MYYNITLSPLTCYFQLNFGSVFEFAGYKYVQFLSKIKFELNRCKNAARPDPAKQNARMVRIDSAAIHAALLTGMVEK
jgi:hypothetical protein